ncbi:flavin reductase family protein [Streptomyces sp. NPDC058611]|uniref:flavin reductase family protein n=1 Tax=unclassified Streptomyces TaxID=2593676 RepID=UPI00364B23FC
MPDLDAFTEELDGAMYVVTAAAGDRRAGCLVGFASQCSIHPPRFVVWLSTANHTYRVARGASHLTVHLLRKDQKALAERFGSLTGDRVDTFAGTDWRPGTEGSPVLAEADTWFTGRVEGQIEGGDHVGFLLAPVAEGRPDKGRPAGSPHPAPLQYGDVRDVEPGHAP